MKSFAKYIAKQFGNPSGFGGTIIHFIMNKQNLRQYNAVQDNIRIQSTDIILDVGFGNGYLIKKLLEQNPQKIYGIEISQDMLKKVSRKLKHLISEDKLNLCLADVKRVPYNDAFFDKICTVNTLYFWDDIESSFAEIKRTLKPNGIFINVFYSKEILDKMHHTQYEYSKYSLDEITGMTEKSGLKVIQIVEIQKGVSYCIIAKNNDLK
ncbi:MAG: class I SAM-dependent methyltransferase [Bacteroidales bacterium]|jgi:ubiquinone/menaquinone biosynthesis C-methylase UbiE|nr:class I SAM-dependent methyltransferase [Bacteroidales bacterium]